MVWYGQCQAGQGGQLGLQTIQIPGRAGYIAFKMDFTSPLDCQLESGQSQSVTVECGNIKTKDELFLCLLGYKTSQ